jgi:hypothetical protein
MVTALRNRWHAELSFDEMTELARELGTMLHRIRSERHIRPPLIRCRRCGRIGRATEPDITVRAMILAVRRFGIAPTEHVKALEKRWAAYRQQHGLDLYGKVLGAASVEPLGCEHQNLKE